MLKKINNTLENIFSIIDDTYKIINNEAKYVLSSNLYTKESYKQFLEKIKPKIKFIKKISLINNFFSLLIFLFLNFFVIIFFDISIKNIISIFNENPIQTLIYFLLIGFINKLLSLNSTLNRGSINEIIYFLKLLGDENIVFYKKTMVNWKNTVIDCNETNSGENSVKYYPIIGLELKWKNGKKNKLVYYEKEVLSCKFHCLEYEKRNYGADEGSSSKCIEFEYRNESVSKSVYLSIMTDKFQEKTYIGRLRKGKISDILKIEKLNEKVLNECIEIRNKLEKKVLSNENKR